VQEYRAQCFKATFGTVFILCSLAFLSSCQGVSAGSSNTQPTVGALSFSSATLNFGSVNAGTSKALSISATNTGQSAITITSASISTKYFTVTSPAFPASIAAGQNAVITISFAPNVAGAFNATGTITSDASNAQAAITLAGTGVVSGDLSSNPAALTFGSVTVGSTQALSATLTNASSSSITISQASVSGSGFTLSGITPPISLNAGQSTSFSVSFKPASSGAASGNVTITSTAPNPTLNIPISGSGVAAAGQLAVTPTSFNLGSVLVGSSASATGTLSASGANVTISGASTNNSAFTIGGLSLPTTIAAGNSTSFSITFAPTASGTASGTLTFTSNAQPSTTTASLTGSGTPAPTHSVNLSWNASTSSNISGYNIYRAVYVNACGTFSKINSVLDTSTLYTDSNVVNGTSYCYASTAVNTSNQESGYSNVVSNIQIPAQ
jgi:hypothetical protein